MSLSAVLNLDVQKPNSIIIFTQSPTIELLIRKRVRKQINVTSDCVLDIEKVKDLKQAKALTLQAPILCDKWFVNVDCTNIKPADIVASMKYPSENAVYIYWIRDYKTFFGLKRMKEIETMAVKYSLYRLTFLTAQEIDTLENIIITDEDYKLTPQMKQFVKSYYRYDVHGVCTLFDYANSGNDLNTKQDIISLIGLGSVNVTHILMLLLTTNVKDQKDAKKLYKKVMGLMTNLAEELNYQQIRSYSISNLETLRQMKVLQLQGILGYSYMDIPDRYDADKISRMSRYQKRIKQEVSMVDIINLKIALQNFNHFDRQLALMQGIAYYIWNKTEDKSPTKPKEKAPRKKSTKKKKDKVETVKPKEKAKPVQPKEEVKVAEKLTKESIEGLTWIDKVKALSEIKKAEEQIETEEVIEPIEIEVVEDIEPIELETVEEEEIEGIGLDEFDLWGTTESKESIVETETTTLEENKKTNNGDGINTVYDNLDDILKFFK